MLRAPRTTMRSMRRTASRSTAWPSTASPPTASPSTASPSTVSPSTASTSTVSPSTGSPSTGLALNGLAFNGLAFSGLAFNGLSLSGNLPSTSGLMTTPGGRDFVNYLVRVAYPVGHSLTKQDQYGNSYTFEGSLGVAPEAEFGTCDVNCQEKISGAPLAHVNNSGLHRGI